VRRRTVGSDLFLVHAPEAAGSKMRLALSRSRVCHRTVAYALCQDSPPLKIERLASVMMSAETPVRASH
jgi:hypothetical protein